MVKFVFLNLKFVVREFKYLILNFKVWVFELINMQDGMNMRNHPIPNLITLKNNNLVDIKKPVWNIKRPLSAFLRVAVISI